MYKQCKNIGERHKYNQSIRDRRQKPRRTSKDHEFKQLLIFIFAYIKTNYVTFLLDRIALTHYTLFIGAL